MFVREIVELFRLIYIAKALYILGKPTSFAPRPKPAPWRAVRPMLGASRSSRTNVTAAIIATARISSRFNFFWGIITIASATAKPSRKYLTTRVTSSVIVKPSIYNRGNDFLFAMSISFHKMRPCSSI